MSRKPGSQQRGLNKGKQQSSVPLKKGQGVVKRVPRPASDFRSECRVPATASIQISQLVSEQSDAGLVKKLVELTRECLESCDGRCANAATLGGLLRDHATRKGLFADTVVKSISVFMKERWGSLEGFVKAHASEGLAVGADGLIRLVNAAMACDPPMHLEAVSNASPPAWSGDAIPPERPAPSRAAVDDLQALCASMLGTE